MAAGSRTLPIRRTPLRSRDPRGRAGPKFTPPLAFKKRESPDPAVELLSLVSLDLVAAEQRSRGVVPAVGRLPVQRHTVERTADGRPADQRPDEGGYPHKTTVPTARRPFPSPPSGARGKEAGPVKYKPCPTCTGRAATSRHQTDHTMRETRGKAARQSVGQRGP